MFLLVLFASCGLNPASDEDDASLSSVDSTSRRELPKYITLRLDDYGEYVSDSIGIAVGNVVSANGRLDSAVPASSRALTHGNAQASYDFFEAVFYFSTNPGNTAVARAAWSVGETPELRGVYRTAGGVNYSNVGVPPSGQGAAVIFVGSKADKTLLAVGKLVNVDGVISTTITTGTKSVTFEITALSAGVAPNRASAASSSFQTYSEWNAPAALTGLTTDLIDGIYLDNADKKTFPFFKLGQTPGGVNYGAYTFNVAAGSTAFTDYAAGIVLAGERNFEAGNPGGSLLAHDAGMTRGGNLDLMNNNVRLGQPAPGEAPDESSGEAPGEPQGKPPVNYDPVTGPKYFTNPVVFKIDTSASRDGSVFALAFEVFVYNLSARPADSNGPKPVKWRISTGIGAKRLVLDDGNGGEGGAVFLGTGNVVSIVQLGRF